MTEAAPDTPVPGADPLAEVGRFVASALPQAGVEAVGAFGELTLTVAPTQWVEVVRFLRDDPRCAFITFVDLCGVDYPDRLLRFEVVLHLLSPKHNRRIRVKCAADEVTPVPTLS